MGRSLESLSRSQNLDASKDLEGINGYANKPKSFKEHMQELKDHLDSLPKNDNEVTGGDSSNHNQEVVEARDAVLRSFNKETDDTDIERIKTCKNRVFKSEFGPRYDDNPNVFRTNEALVYRITGVDQIADIINCGYVRPKEGKVMGGHENEVFWSIGGDKLNFIDERPILEASIDTVKDGQIGAISLDDLTAVWIFDDESGKRENKLSTIRQIKKFMGKDEQISVEDLNKKIKNGISLTDISSTF